MFAPPPSPDAAPPAVLTAWLAQSHDLLVMTSVDGLIVWANPSFQRSTAAATNLLELLGSAPGFEAQSHAVQQALQTGTWLPDTELCLRGTNGAALWVQARATRVDDHTLWTLQDTSASRALAAQAQRQTELLDLAQDFGRLGVWEREIPSGVGRWDRHVFGFWGMAPTEGTPNYADAMNRIHPEDRRTSIFEKSTLRAGRYSQRYRVLHGDGSTRWIHSQWEVKNSPRGQPDRAVGIMVDDTAAYRLAQSLDSTAAQLRLAAELADIVIWRHDLLTNRVHYNDHGLKVLGIAHRAEGVTLDEARVHAHPDDLALLTAASAKALTSSGPVDVEARHRRPDGSWRRMLVRRVVERGPSGEALAFVGVTLDVTDRHEAFAALHAASERSALITRHAGIGTWETDGADNGLWDEQMFRLRGLEPRPIAPSREERLALVHPDDRALNLDARARLDVDMAPTAYEFRVRLPDASYRWLASRSAALRDEHGKVH
jgi:PAS domain S-box-containing protein